nr:gfo/Idh/MocA family oxidoreductase [bacterium]
QELDMDEARRKEGGFDVDELGVGFATFEGGATMDILESWAIHMNAFEGSFLAGSKGGVRLAPQFSFHSFLADMAMNATFNLDADEDRWHSLNPDFRFFDSPQHHWIGSLLGRVPAIDTAGIALDTMLISEGIYLSQQLGREVTAQEIIASSRSTALVRQALPSGGELVYPAL